MVVNGLRQARGRKARSGSNSSGCVASGSNCPNSACTGAACSEPRTVAKPRCQQWSARPRHARRQPGEHQQRQPGRTAQRRRGPAQHRVREQRLRPGCRQQGFEPEPQRAGGVGIEARASAPRTAGGSAAIGCTSACTRGPMPSARADRYRRAIVRRQRLRRLKIEFETMPGPASRFSNQSSIPAPLPA